jgi:hypothetical protein
MHPTTGLAAVASAMACACVLAFAPPAQAATLHVPTSQFPTIQSAVDAAASGDVIEVQPGTYRERLRIVRDGVTLTIRGWAGPAQTTIDANGGGAALVVGAGDIRIEGLRITGGTGHRSQSHPDPLGGGVALNQRDGAITRVTFRTCVIEGNSALGTNADGGGIFLGSRAQATFRNCAIRNNRAGRHGGGIILGIGASAEFVGGSISDNASGRSTNGGAGGGLFVGNGTVNLSGTRITGNVSRYAGGGVEVFNDLRQPERRSTFGNCEIRDNTVQPGPGDLAYGGGLHAEDNAVVRLVGCRISDNRARAGGGISNFRAQVIVERSIIDANAVVGQGPGEQGLGGGISSTGSGSGAGEPCARLILTETAVHENTATRRGGGIYTSAGDGCTPGRARLVLDRSLIGENRVGGEPETVAPAVGGGIHALQADLEARDSQIIGNRGDKPRSHGGGIVLVGDRSKGTITGSTIASNRAAERGSGLFLDGTEVTLERSQVHANSSTDPDLPRRGGVFVGSQGARGSISDNDIADNEGFQIIENSQEQTAINYRGNRLEHRPGGAIYASFAPRHTATNVPDFERLVAPRAQSNVQQAPTFVSFTATPDRYSSTMPAFLAWSVGRAASAEVTGVAQPTVPSGVADVQGACPKTFTLSGQRIDGSAYGEEAVSVGCADPPPPPGPALPGPTGDPPISNQFSFGGLSRNLNRGIARLAVRVPGPGRVVLRRTKQVRRAVRRVTGDGGGAGLAGARVAQSASVVRLPVRPRGKAQRRISKRRCARSGKRRLAVRVRARVTYRPVGGAPRTQQRRVRLVRRC